MSYIGNKPTAVPLTSADLEDNIISTAKIQDNAVTAAKYVEAPSFRNLIINGDMSIAQRGTSFTCSNSTGSKYTLDRFQYIDVDTPDSVYTITPSTDVPTGQGFAKSLKVDVATADASLDANDGTQIQQSIEAQNLQHLKIGTSSAESLTLSFWVKSNKTGTYVVRLLQPDSSSRMVSFAYTISSASTWEKKTISIPADTSGNINNDNGSGLNITWWLSAGSSYTSGSLASTWQAYSNGDSAVGQVNLADNTANEWYITGVQLEVGTSASDFEFLPYDVNYQRCARYFYRQDYNTNGSSLPVTHNYGTGNSYGVIFTPVMMRARPTLAYSSASHFLMLYGGSQGAPNQLVREGGNGFAQEFRVDRTGLTAGQSAWTRLDNASATFDLDSEL